MHSNQGQEYEVTYAIGDKVYKEENFIIPTHQFESDFCQNPVVDFCFGERGTKANSYAKSFFCAAGTFFGSAVFGLAAGISQLAAIGGIGGAICCVATPCAGHCGDKCCGCQDEVDPHLVTAEIIATQPKLQDLQVSCDITTIKVEEYKKKQSFIKFLEKAEKSDNFNIADIIKRSNLIIEVPKIIIGKGKVQFGDLYKKYQIHELLKKYRSTGEQLVIRIPFDIQHKGEEKSGSGYVEYIAINHELIRCATDSRGREYQVGKSIEKLELKKNYVITEGDMFLISWWESHDTHRKKDKVISKKERIAIKICANGDVKIKDEYAKAYQAGKINIDNGTSNLFIDGIPFAQAVAHGNWKMQEKPRVSSVITEQPQPSAPMVEYNIKQASVSPVIAAEVHRH